MVEDAMAGGFGAKFKDVTLIAQASTERHWRGSSGSWCPAIIIPGLRAGGMDWVMCSEEVTMSSGLLKSARTQKGATPSYLVRWALPTDPPAETGLPEGSGLIWHVQNELPSRRWYLDAAREVEQ